jgi:hypothetical protein
MLRDFMKQTVDVYTKAVMLVMNPNAEWCVCASWIMKAVTTAGMKACWRAACQRSKKLAFRRALAL